MPPRILYTPPSFGIRAHPGNRVHSSRDGTSQRSLLAELICGSRSFAGETEGCCVAWVWFRRVTARTLIRRRRRRLWSLLSSPNSSALFCFSSRPRLHNLATYTPFIQSRLRHHHKCASESIRPPAHQSSHRQSLDRHYFINNQTKWRQNKITMPTTWPWDLHRVTQHKPMGNTNDMAGNRVTQRRRIGTATSRK